MAKKKSISERRRLSGRYSSIPDLMYKSEAYKSLQSQSRDIMTFLIFQYNGDNNGDLTCTFEAITNYWGMAISKKTFYRHLSELIDKMLVIKTVQGGKHKASRFAVAIYAIDEGGELEKTTSKAPAKFLGWKDEN